MTDESPRKPSLAALVKSRLLTPAAAAVALMCFGAYLRALGMFDLELWADEARWAVHLLEGTGTLRPAGYMWLSRRLIDLVHNEPMLRSLSYASGLALLPLSYVLLRRLLGEPWLAVLGLLLLVVSPIEVAMTKEFKPYMLETFVHGALVLLALQYHRRASTPLLAALLAGAMLSTLLSWTIVFLFPAIFLVAAHGARRRGPKSLVAVAVSTIATLGLLLAVHAMRVADKKPDPSFWGDKYDVFFMGEGALDRLMWLARKTVGIAEFPARLDWSLPIGGGAAVFFAVTCAAGLAGLIAHRRYVHAALLASPWGIALAFNLAGQWPYGPFRTNVFLLLYAIALSMCGLDLALRFVAKHRPRWRAPLLAGLAGLGALVVPLELDAFRDKGPGTMTASASVRAAMERLYDLERDADRGGKRTLLLDGHACEIFRYYKGYHPETSVRLGAWFDDNTRVHCTLYNRRHYLKTLRKHRKRSFWLIVGQEQFVEATRRELAPYCDIRHDILLPHGTLLLRCEAKRRKK